MIVGVGVDIVDVKRFQQLLQRSPRTLDRVLTPGERTRADGSGRDAASLAARFAAKEAVAKALRAPSGLAWHDCEVRQGADGAPGIAVRGTVAAAARARGVTHWHVSLSHDGPVAVAYVIAEGRVAGGGPGTTSQRPDHEQGEGWL